MKTPSWTTFLPNRFFFHSFFFHAATAYTMSTTKYYLLLLLLVLHYAARFQWMPVANEIRGKTVHWAQTFFKFSLLFPVFSFLEHAGHADALAPFRVVELASLLFFFPRCWRSVTPPSPVFLIYKNSFFFRYIFFSVSCVVCVVYLVYSLVQFSSHSVRHPILLYSVPVVNLFYIRHFSLSPPILPPTLHLFFVPFFGLVCFYYIYI